MPGHARPGTYKGLLAGLSSGAALLPKRLRQVAVWVTRHPAYVALGTISAMSGAIGVQPSTLVFFAQLSGYAGYPDLQDIFKASEKYRRTARR